MPPPNVDSCVIRLDIKEKTPDGVEDEDFFFKTVKAAFSQRRKTLANSVSSNFGVNKDLVYKAINVSNLKESIRPEQMDMEDFITLANNLKKLL